MEQSRGDTGYVRKGRGRGEAEEGTGSTDTKRDRSSQLEDGLRNAQDPDDEPSKEA